MNNTTMVMDSEFFHKTESDKPTFEIVKAIPKGIAPQIENAVVDFIHASHTPEGVHLGGFYQHTLQSIASASILNQGGDLWLGIKDGELYTYILAHIGQDVDHRLAYIVTQAWVREDQRGKPWVKWAWEKVRQRAKDSFCGHLMVISSRGNDKAYCRFLGKGFRPYASILKEEF